MTRLAVARATFGLLLVGTVACSKSAPATDNSNLTERQKDSILAQSSIPGAQAVGKAMRVADSTSSEARATDTAAP